MLKLNDFIVLRAYFDMELSDAILEKDIQAVQNHMIEHYQYEIMENIIFLKDVMVLDKKSMQNIHDEHVLDLKNDKLVPIFL